MTFSRVVSLAALALAVASCTPSIPQEASPASVVTAIFDPAAGDIPLPSDLVLLDPTSLALPAAQKELLGVFKAQNGFPNDQEVAVTISFARDQIHADGSLTRVAPSIDPASFTPNTFFVFGVTSGGTVAGEIPVEPITASDLTTGPGAGGNGTVTTLTLHHKGRTPWAPGQYAVLVRGGRDGIKTIEGDPVWPSSVFFLVAQGNDMTKPDNLGLLVAQTGSHDAAMALATQLNMIIAGYRPAYAACDTRFPHQELASLVGFTVAPARTQVDLDPGRGLVPLPIDLLRDPRPASASCTTCGKLTPLAACTLAGGSLNAAGACSSAGAAGFAALDGFSTTAPILAPTNDLVLASTVDATTYRLYDLTNPASPVLVPPSSYLIEPEEFTSSGMSPVVASQPVGATAADPTSVFRSRPLKDDTHYAVVITTGVKDKTGAALGRGTVGSVLLFDNPLVDGTTGKSQLIGIDDATAGALEVMRNQLLPLRSGATPLVNKADIAMAYTFKTQSITGLATRLAAMPYQAALANPAAGNTLITASGNALAAFDKYGVSPTIPNGNIDQVIEAKIVTYNLLDPVTGAFNPAGPQLETIDVLIATPKAAAAPLCSGAMAAFGGAGIHCAPLMVFRHGLGRGRADMLLVADTYAAKGLVTVAIDAAKHGDRAYCTTGSTNQCLPGSTCQAVPGFGTQGDATVPGRCTAGATNGDGLPARNAVAGGTCPGGPFTCGIPVFSANYLISANFFRTRDTLRQDIIDQSQLILATAFVPKGLPPTGHGLFDHMVGRGLVIDPTAITYSGQSLGAIQGTVNVATNPRIGRAVLNVGGGTLVDIFTTSPAFSSGINKLLAAMGISPGTSKYLQFLSVAKLVLDPADPINFAGHLTSNNLPNLLTTPVSTQAPKRILTQAALCDQTVPNTWNYVLDANAGSAPLPLVDATFGTGTGTFQLFARAAGSPATIPAAIQACGVPGATSPHAMAHGFLADWSFSAAATLQAQSDAADFVLSPTFLPTSLVVVP